MNKGVLRFLPALLFIITGAMAIANNRDYWEAASWFCFAIAVIIPALKSEGTPGSKQTRTIAYIFGGIGLVLLILRLLNVLPVPVRPLP
jgi:hypothetical protein